MQISKLFPKKYIPDDVINEAFSYGIIESFNDEVRVYSYKAICDMCYLHSFTYYMICEESLQYTCSKETEYQDSKCQCSTVKVKVKVRVKVKIKIKIKLVGLVRGN